MCKDTNSDKPAAGCSRTDWLRTLYRKEKPGGTKDRNI